jgi:protein-tyrosine-phosphatase
MKNDTQRTKQKSKVITNDIIKGSVKAVNMGCIDKSEYHVLFIGNVLDWGIEDPKGKSIKKVREIRDKIERKVKQTAETLKESDNK